MQIEELVSGKDVAGKFKLPEKTLAEWRSRGIGPPYLKIGRHVRYRPVDIETWLVSQAVMPTDASRRGAPIRSQQAKAGGRGKAS